jgi:hypothetical protein
LSGPGIQFVFCGCHRANIVWCQQHDGEANIGVRFELLNDRPPFIGLLV